MTEVLEEALGAALLGAGPSGEEGVGEVCCLEGEPGAPLCD